MSRRILVGYDHTEESAAGLRRAAALAQTERAELTVVHVAVPPPSWVGVGMLALPVFDDVVASGTSLVRAACDELPRDIALRWHLLTGADASTSLCRHRCVRRALRRAMQDGDHDVIVLGTGLQPGRVARWLLRHAGDRRVLTAPFAHAEPGAGTAHMRPSVSLK